MTEADSNNPIVLKPEVASATNVHQLQLARLHVHQLQLHNFKGMHAHAHELLPRNSSASCRQFPSMLQLLSCCTTNTLDQSVLYNCSVLQYELWYWQLLRMYSEHRLGVYMIRAEITGLHWMTWPVIQQQVCTCASSM